MHIVQIHHEKVPVRGYGGTERVIEALCEAHIAAGHKVTLISYKGDYEIPGVNFIDIKSLGHDDPDADKFAPLIPKDADILHFHVAMDIKKRGIEIPAVFTLHGNTDDIDSLPETMIGISQDHASRHKCKHYVYNGLNFDGVEIGTDLNQREGFSFLGRASLKRKGLKEAKKIVRTLKENLFVGGGRGLNFRGIKYLGSLDNKAKYKLLSETKALLFPISWEEPFGLVMIEAMACGTPVFAFKRGSVSEVLGQEGAEGIFLIEENTEDLINSIQEYDYSKTDPKKIRAYVDKYFSSTVMAEGYRKLYQRAIEKNW